MKFVSAAALLLGCLFVALSLYQLNQYWMASSTIGPSLSQLSEVTKDPSALASLGLSASDLEASKNTVLAGTNSMLQNFALDFVLGLAFLFAGFKTGGGKLD